jgi:hypothetical protein
MRFSKTSIAKGKEWRGNLTVFGLHSELMGLDWIGLGAVLVADG